MGAIVSMAEIILIGSMLFTTYPQQLCINTKIQNDKEIKVEEKHINKDLGYLKEDIKIPEFIGGKDEKKIALINNRICNDIKPKIEEAEKTSSDYFKDVGEQIPRFPYEILSKYTVTKDNGLIISLFNDYYEFLGGAHGMTTKTSYTVDKKKESLLTLEDLFTKGYDYKTIINSQIKEQISKKPQDYFDSGSEFKGISEKQNFYIEDDNLVIYYQLYELAPYVFGFPQFKIPLKSFEKNFIYYKDWNYK